MTAPFALTGARIFDGAAFHADRALVVADGRVAAVAPLAEAPARRVALDGLTLAPGFVDWQVNGGGGALFNADPTPEGVARIAAAHARFGVTAMTPTLITDAPAVQQAAADAIAAALAAGTPGVVGAHFEGPHLAAARKGAHDAAHIRPMDAADRRLLSREDLGRVVVTLAPETVDADAVGWLSRAGLLVSLGHSDADYETAMASFHAGARAVTHLFNAMSGPDKRAPGLAGAALDAPNVAVGLIADGWHVHPAMARLALRAKPSGMVTLVSDAMPTAAGGPDRFTLNGRTVTRRGGRLTLAGDVLAGSDLTLDAAMRFAVDRLDAPLAEALRMASAYPATLLGLPDRGHLRAGARADVVALDNALRPARVWIGGREVAR